MNSDKTSVSEVKRFAEHAGVEIINRYKHQVIMINGMDCSDCALVVEHSIGRMDGVLIAQVNYASKKLWVEYDTHAITSRGIEQRLASLGYEIPLEGSKKWLQENKELLMSAASGLLLLTGWIGVRFLGLPTSLSWVLFIAAYIVGVGNCSTCLSCSQRAPV